MAASVSKHMRTGEWTGRYRARMTLLDGSHRSRVFDTRGQAKAWLVEQQAAVSTGSYVDPTKARKTLGAFLEAGGLPELNLKPSSRDRAERIRRTHIDDRWGDVSLGKITTEELQSWIVELSLTSGLAAATVRHVGVQMGKILKRAALLGAIPANPMESVKLPRPDDVEMRFITAEQVIALSEAIDQRYAAMVLAAGFGGFRFGELAALRPANVATKDGTRVIIKENAVMVGGHVEFGTPKSRASRRSVLLPASIGRAFDMHLLVHSNDRFVFPAPGGGVLHTNNFRRRFWTPAVTKAGLEPLRFHDLRHSAISIWISNDFSVKRVASWAGHASSSFTLDRYGHLFRDDDDVSAARLDDLFPELAQS